jgi:hypothetical protein
MANPLDYLKDKNKGWEDIATAFMQRSSSFDRKALLGTVFLGIMNAKENAMIANTNKKLRELERERIAEKSKITEQHRKRNLIFDDLDKWDVDNNYFKTKAAAEFDADQDNSVYLSNVAGPLGPEKSETAQAIRQENIDKRAKGLENQMWAKLGYTANKDGIFNIDPTTRRPYQTDDPATTDYIEKFNPEQLSQVRLRQTEDEYMLPFNQYYDKRIEGLLRPENISWAAKTLNRFGFGKKTNEAFEKDLETLSGLVEEQKIKNANIVSPFVRIIDVEGKPVATTEGHENFQPLLISDVGNIEISKKEAIQRVFYSPELTDTTMKQNVITEINKVFADSPNKKITIDNLSLKISDEFEGYNQKTEANQKEMEAFMSGYFRANQREMEEAGITGEVDKGLDFNSVLLAKTDIVSGVLKLINPVTGKPYDDKIVKAREIYLQDQEIKQKQLIGMDTTVDKLLTQVRQLNDFIKDPNVDTSSEEYLAVMNQLINYTMDDFTKAELKLADMLITSPTNRTLVEQTLRYDGVYEMERENDKGLMETVQVTSYSEYADVLRTNALKAGKRTYRWILENR